MSMDMLYDTSSLTQSSCETMFNASNSNMYAFIRHVNEELAKAIKYTEANIEENEDFEATDDPGYNDWRQEQIEEDRQILNDLRASQCAWSSLEANLHTNVYALTVGISFLELDEPFQKYMKCIMHAAIKCLHYNGNVQVWVA